MIAVTTNIARQFRLLRKYHDIGGTSLVLAALVSKLESVVRTGDRYDETTISLNGHQYRVEGGYSAQKWRQFERGVIMPEVKRAMREQLDGGDTFLDVGAAMGDTALYAHSLVGTSGTIHAYEPDVNLYAVLTDLVSRNGLDNVTCHRRAVGAERGELPPEAVLGQTQEAFAEQVASVESIPVTSLDAFTGASGVEPDLVKVDVDGAEDQVLAGMGDELAYPVVLELHDSNLLENRTETLDRVFELADDVVYLAAQGVTPSRYRYGTRLSGPDDLSDDVVTNLLLR